MNPLFVDIFVNARQHAQHFARARVDADIARHAVGHINAFGVREFPRARGETVRRRGQRADRTHINEAARQFAVQRTPERRDARVFAATDDAEVFHARDFRREADAPRAVNAAIHKGLNERPHVLLGDGAFFIGEAAVSASVSERLILEVAFAALVADRAVQRMIDELNFHHALARGFDGGGVGADDHSVAGGHRAGGDRFRGAFHFNEAHAAEAGD